MSEAGGGECVFCRIISGELPATRIFEDERVVAFFPLKVINPGHLLLMPKDHYEHYIDMPDELITHMALVAKTLGRRIQDHVAPVRVGFAAVGLGITHAHMHIVPMHKMYELTSSAYARVVDGELVWSEDWLTILSDEERATLAAQLREV